MAAACWAQQPGLGAVLLSWQLCCIAGLEQLSQHGLGTEGWQVYLHAAKGSWAAGLTHYHQVGKSS